MRHQHDSVRRSVREEMGGERSTSCATSIVSRNGRGGHSTTPFPSVRPPSPPLSTWAHIPDLDSRLGNPPFDRSQSKHSHHHPTFSTRKRHRLPRVLCAVRPPPSKAIFGATEGAAQCTSQHHPSQESLPRQRSAALAQRDWSDPVPSGAVQVAPGRKKQKASVGTSGSSDGRGIAARPRQEREREKLGGAQWSHHQTKTRERAG